jgi:hypothetical protein
LKQVVTAAFDVLDPALGSVIRNFKGTADEIAAFGNVLLSVHDATKDLSDGVRQNVIGALDSTTETANKVLAFVSVLNTFGDSLSGLRPTLEGLAPEKITAFVDALGGAQAFFDAFAFLNANFLTTAERTAQATAQLVSAFDALGIALPKTHQEFLQLVNAAIAAGNVDLAASLEKLAPLFVTVNGTADQAAEALAKLGDAAGDAADVIEKAATQITVSVGGIIHETQDLANTLLGQFRDLANESTGGFGDKLAIQIGLIQDAIENANRSDFTSTTAFNTYVGTLNKSAQQLADELGRFTVLSAQYDAQRAEQLVALQDWYNEQFHIFGGDTAFNKNLAALDALKTIFDQKWAAIVAGSAVATESLDDFIRKIQSFADSTRGNVGQQAQLELALSLAKINELTIAYRSLSGPASAQAASLFTQITKLRAYNDSLALQLAHFTTYTAQYGVEVANQLVELENQFASWRDQVGDNADALAILQQIFDDQWKAIIDGIKTGVDGSLEQLARLKQGIADYLKGLVVSDISPLSPFEKLQQAQLAFQNELALAQGGDVKALGDVTQFADTFLQLSRDFYKSSQPFVDAFDMVTEQLASIAGSTPTGQPLPTGDASLAAIASVLPTSGSLASSENIASLEAKVEEMIQALAESNATDVQQQTSLLTQAQRDALADAAASAAK